MAQIKQKDRNVKRKTMFAAQNGFLRGPLWSFVVLPVREKQFYWLIYWTGFGFFDFTFCLPGYTL
jgi:hypothetical protein